MLVGWRKFIIGETAIVALTILAIVIGDVSPHVCYAIATIATGVSFANAIKPKNGTK